MNMPLNLLLIEDSETDAFLLVRNLRKNGFEIEFRQVDTAGAFETALAQGGWDVIVSDFNLPQFSGKEALEIFRGHELDIPFIVVSGTIGEEMAVSMVKAGAQDYIMKDNMTRLATAIHRALDEVRLRKEKREALEKLMQSEARYRAVVEDQMEFINRHTLDGTYTFVNKTYARLADTHPENMIGRNIAEFFPPDEIEAIKSTWAQLSVERPVVATETHFLDRDGQVRWFLWRDRLVFDANRQPLEIQSVGHDITERKRMEDALRNREEQLRQANLELELAYDTTLEGWAKALELRDKETEGHSRNVTGLTVLMARKMGFSDEQLIHIRRGALLHDIGKMGIPDHILLKAGDLTEEEWDIMKKHPVYANDLLSKIDFLKPALAIPYSHHERWNGSGYPLGLKGEEIPLEARIFAVVDCWDALRSDRPYRRAWPFERTFAYFKAESGRLFDPQVVAVFLEEIQKLDRV